MITVDLTHIDNLPEFHKEIRRLHEEDNDEHYCLLHDVIVKLRGECDTYKELGTNQGGTASAAALAGYKCIFIDYRFHQIQPYWHLFKPYDVEFRQVDSASGSAAEGEVDLLLIDSLHKAYHLKKELVVHKDAVKKYIAFHDTHAYKSLLPVIDWFCKEYSWEITEHHDKGAGYTLIRRK